MSRYDGLIIPRSYSEYINKTDAATLLQALQLSGVMDNAPTANSNHPTKSGGIFDELKKRDWKYIPVDFSFSNIGTGIVNIYTFTETFKEMLVITQEGVSHLMRIDGINEAVDVIYAYLYPGYNLSYEVRMNWNENKLKGRQTMKESNAAWINVIGVYYR